MEITAREQVFAPRERGLGYIRICGFCFECAADGVPVPQRGMVSTSRGHHWIIEKNQVRWANACGIDVGNQDWKAARPAEFGRHVLRGNRVSDCGVCGIAGCGCVDQTLVEDNLIERVGGLDIERMWEVAGLKFHTAHSVLIRRNTFRDLHRAAGIWLDYLNANCRITGNLFQEISSCNGALFVEVSHAPNVLDHNVFWNIRPSGGAEPAGPKDGSAVCTDSSTDTVAAYNFFGNVRGFAACVNNLQAERMIADGRKGDAAGTRCSTTSFSPVPGGSTSAAAKATAATATCSTPTKDGLFDVQDPAPNPKPRLGTWQSTFGQDRRSAAAPMEAASSSADGRLRYSCPKAASLRARSSAGRIGAGRGPRAVRCRAMEIAPRGESDPRPLTDAPLSSELARGAIYHTPPRGCVAIRGNWIIISGILKFGGRGLLFVFRPPNAEGTTQ